MAFREGFKKNQHFFLIMLCIIFVFFSIASIASKRRVRIGKEYTDKYDVALYLKKYHELPTNYISKAYMEECKENGISTEGKIVGGDYYGDYENKLKGFHLGDVSLRECDIYDSGYTATIEGRKLHRFVYTYGTSNVRIFETKDHYLTFSEVTKFKIMPDHYVVTFLLINHIIGSSVILIYVYFPRLNMPNKEEETIDAEVIEIN